ncbi:MAG: xanthine dehydrogenase family protein subunit M [Desulfobacteraceae bacterium]|nr:xanthine dehydrogenase family protein subunit M [Desulfobacteraceae bacterium]
MESNTEYLRAVNLQNALDMAERYRPGIFVAGCTNVIPNMRANAISPKFLIDLSRIDELAGIKEEDDEISIGAATTISKILESELIKKHASILWSAAGMLGNPLTRNRATVGGNLADASPAADTAPPLLALEATVHTAQPKGGGRSIPLDQFFVNPKETVLAVDELITRISFVKPKALSKGWHTKLGLRNAMAISVVSIALMLEMEGNICRKARIALGSLAPKPVRAYLTEKELEGKEITDEVLRQCANTADHEISPISDIRASAEYRRLVTATLLMRSIREAIKGEERGL